MLLSGLRHSVRPNFFDERRIVFDATAFRREVLQRLAGPLSEDIREEFQSRRALDFVFAHRLFSTLSFRQQAGAVGAVFALTALPAAPGARVKGQYLRTWIIAALFRHAYCRISSPLRAPHSNLAFHSRPDRERERERNVTSSFVALIGYRLP